MLRSLVLGLLIVASARPALAEPLGTARVAVIDTSRLWTSTGIQRWAAARAALDAEEGTYTPAEAPPGADPRPMTRIEIPPGLDKETRDRIKRELDEIDKKTARSEVWSAHENEVLNPIVADVRAKLAQFAAAHGIGLLIDTSATAGMIVTIPATDITAAFIKDYNARTPAKR